MISRTVHHESRLPKPLPVEPEPSTEHDPADLDAETLSIVRARIVKAAQAYRAHKPGQAEYHLVRAGLAIARYHGDVEAATTLSELRLVKVPGADEEDDPGNERANPFLWKTADS